MSKRLMIHWVIGVLVALAAMEVYADLILELNTDAKTFAITGSCDAIFANEVGRPTVSWRVDGQGGTGSGAISQAYDNDVAWTSSAGTPGSGGSGGYDTQLFANSGFAGGRVIVRLANSQTGASTVTGTGVHQTYQFLGHESTLENTAGSTLTPAVGSGCVMSVSAVPEPSAFLYLTLIGAAVGVLVRFRKGKRINHLAS